MNDISKNIIITYAKALRTIQKEKIDPYIELIEKELNKLYPELKDREDNALNWAYDILNADSNTEVVEILSRLESILADERKEKWVCCICGENTYDVDCENLSGTDHLSCLLTEELKHKNDNNQFNVLKEELSYIKEAIVRLENRLNELESK